MGSSYYPAGELAGNYLHPGSAINSCVSEIMSPSTLSRLLQTIPDFFQPGTGTIVIQFSPRGAACANRSNRLIPEFDYNSTSKEHDVRKLR